MAKLTLYGREIEVHATLPEIYVVNPDDVEFLMFKADQLFDQAWNDPLSANYKVDGRLEIDLTGAFITAMTPPETSAVTDGHPFRGLWRAKCLFTKIDLAVDRGVEQ